MENATAGRSEPSFEKILSAFHAGKVIDENVTLKQLAAVSTRLSETLGDSGDDAMWSFVSKHYVYKGDAAVADAPKS